MNVGRMIAVPTSRPCRTSPYTHHPANATAPISQSHVSTRLRGVSRWCTRASSSWRKSSRSAGVIGCASSSFARKSVCSCDITVSVLDDFSNGLLAVMQPGLDRPGRNVQHLRDLVDRQVLEEVECQRLAL